jgi:hypothetical protein
MATINNTILRVVALWFYVGIGPLVGTGPMEHHLRTRRGVRRLGSAEKRPATAIRKPAFANPNR